jgi:transposase
MNTSEAAQTAPSRSRDETKDDPTLWEVDEALWARIAPRLVVDKPRTKPGRPRRDDRARVNGLIWMARTGAQWAALPAALPAAFGPKSTGHARFQEWERSGTFPKLWAVLLAADDDLVGVEGQWQAAAGCLVKAPLGKRGLAVRRRRRGAPRPTAAKAGPRAPG